MRACTLSWPLAGAAAGCCAGACGAASVLELCAWTVGIAGRPSASRRAKRRDKDIFLGIPPQRTENNPQASEQALPAQAACVAYLQSARNKDDRDGQRSP